MADSAYARLGRSNRIFLGWDFRSQARAFAPERAALQAARCDGYRDRDDGLRSTTLVDVTLG